MTCIFQALDNGKFVLGAPPEPGQVSFWKGKLFSAVGIFTPTLHFLFSR
jgi:hypothetical protein